MNHPRCSLPVFIARSLRLSPRGGACTGTEEGGEMQSSEDSGSQASTSRGREGERPSSPPKTSNDGMTTRRPFISLGNGIMCCSHVTFYGRGGHFYRRKPTSRRIGVSSDLSAHLSFCRIHGLLSLSQIQKVTRGHFGRQKASIVRKELREKCSSTKIQAVWRGLQGRRRASCTRQLVEETRVSFYRCVSSLSP